MGRETEEPLSCRSAMGPPAGWGAAVSMSEPDPPSSAGGVPRSRSSLFEEQGRQALKPGFRLWCPAPALTPRPFPAVSPAAGPLTSLLPVACPSPQGFTFGKAGEILTRRLRYLVFRSMLRQVGLPGMAPGGCALCPVGRRWDCCWAAARARGALLGMGSGPGSPRARWRLPGGLPSTLRLSSCRRRRWKQYSVPPHPSPLLLSFSPWETRDALVYSCQEVPSEPFVSTDQKSAPRPACCCLVSVQGLG